MTSFLRYLLYMLALLTAKNPEEVSADTDKVIVMDEFGNRSQQILQHQQQQQQPSNLFHHQGYNSQYQRHTQQQLQLGHDPNVQSDSPNQDHQCGDILKKARYGIIQTPNFPNKFPVPITCVWIIDASDLVTGPNISIVVYLTQLYVLGGLKFTEYMYYGDDYKVPSHSVFEMTEDDVTQVAWIQFNSPYLEIRFTMKTLDGTHLRALDRLLDVYGFNITYEVDTVKPYQCNALQCRFLGHCYAEQDFSSYYCSCFPGFSGSDCGKGPLCENPDINFCENGGTCKHIGDTAVTCLCPSGYKGNKCEIPEIYDLTSCTPQGASDCHQQCILTELDSSASNPCSCNNLKKGIQENAPANRSGKTRYEVTIRLGSNLTLYRNMESSERRANEHHLTTLLEKHVSFVNLISSYLRRLKGRPDN